MSGGKANLAKTPSSRSAPRRIFGWS